MWIEQRKSRLYNFYLLVVFSLLMVSCRSDRPFPERRYLFLGHPYDWHDGHSMDPRLEALPYDCYDMIWLGGDVCSRTTESPRALRYLDSLLDFSTGRIHWALGNHDVEYGHPDWIMAYTRRPAFYTYCQDDLCLMVINTNLFWMYAAPPPQRDCAQKLAQQQMITRVLDTIRSASHLIILHHHALLKEWKPPELQRTFNVEPDRVTVSCNTDSQFATLFGDRLRAVQRRGVQVLLVGGDVGMRAKKFSYRTPEGIWLLGSGINNSVPRGAAPNYVEDFGPDEVLVFHHQPKTRQLRWAFYPLEEWRQPAVQEQFCRR